MSTTARRLGLAGLALGGMLLPGAALAHPHVFVDAKSEIVFDEYGRIASVRAIWQFDEAFTAFAVQGLDANNDGKLDDSELAPLAKVNVDSLKEYDYFTWLTIDGVEVKLKPPEEYFLQFHGGRLTLFFTLPVADPAPVKGETRLEVYDPEYFVAFSFVEDRPIALDHAPRGCAAVYHPPRELDASSAAVLAAIPADQRDLPPDLAQLTNGLANVVTISCGR